MKTPTIFGRTISSSRIALASSGETRRSELQKWKPIMSAPASPAKRALSRSQMPQILIRIMRPTRARRSGSLRQLSDLRGRIGGTHQQLADQDGVGPRLPHTPRVLETLDAALRDENDVGRYELAQTLAPSQINGQRPKVTVVDSHRRRTRLERRGSLVLVVDLDQRGETTALRDRDEILELRGVERCDDQQHRLGSASSRFSDLERVGHEVFAQDRERSEEHTSELQSR